ncbi:hypothetical protein As57867_004097, partial [Aphanomyces stellatus]
MIAPAPSTNSWISTLPVDGRTLHVATRERLTALAGVSYLVLTLSGSVYFVVLAQPSLTNNLYWAHYNTTGTESCLIDIANVKLSTTGHGNLNLLAQDATMRKNYANAAQSQPTFEPGYARRVLFTELNTVHQAILNIRSSPNQWWFDAQYCWVDFNQTWDVAHTAARSLRCRQRYQDNGASYIEGLLRNVDWHGFLGICGEWWNEAVAAELLRTPAGVQWLADRPQSSLQFDADAEVAYWQTWNLTRYDLQWQNKYLIAITESLLVENVLANHATMPLKSTSPAGGPWTSAMLFWNFQNDLWLPYCSNLSLVRGAPNHFDTAGLPAASLYGIEDANGAFTDQTGVFYDKLGPFGSVDALYVPVPVSLLTLYTTFKTSLYQVLTSKLSFRMTFDAVSGFDFTPMPPAFIVDPGVVYVGGNPLCLHNGPTPYPQSQFSFEDACASQSHFTLFASSHALIFALLAADAIQIECVCAFQRSIGCVQALIETQALQSDFDSQRSLIRALIKQATSDAPPIELFQYAQNTTDNSWLMLHQPLLTSDVNWSFFGWLALFDWIQGTREVIRFEGDVTTLVLISEASAPVVLATGNDNQSNSTILYYMLLYTTIASAFVGIGGVFYTFVHGCQISGRNLFLFNRVAGSVWIGRPLLLVRALVASIVLGTCQDQLMLLPDGGYSKFTAAPRSIWSSMVVAGEATWVSYVIGDVLLVSMHASSAKVIAPMASTLAWLAIVILDYAFPVTLTAQLNRKCTADNTYQYLHCQSGSIRVGSWPRIAIVFLLQIGSLVVAIFVVCLLQRRLQGGKCQTRPSLVLHGAANAFLYRRLDDNKHNNVWQLDDATLLLCGLISFTWRHHMYTFDIKRWVFLDAKHNIQMHQQSALLFENPHLANATQVVPVDVAVGSTTERHPRRRVVIFGLIYVLLSTVGSVSYIVLSTVNFANDFYWVTFNMTGHHVAIANWFNENVMLSRTLFAFRLDDLRCSSMQLEFSDMTQQVRSSPWLAPRLQFEDLTGVLPAIQGLRQSNPCLGPWIMTQYCWVDFGRQWPMANSQARQTRCASSVTNGAIYLEALLRNLDWNVWTSCWGSSFDIAFGTTLRSTSAGQAWLRMTETNYLTTSIADEVSYWSHANIQHYTVQWQNYKSTG